MMTSRRSVSSALVLFLSACGHGPGAPVAAAGGGEPIAVRVGTAEARTRAATLAVDGTLLADEDSNVTSVVPGRVLEVFVERGSIVAAGDPLVRLRDVDYRLQARAAEANLAQARARLGLTDAAAAAPALEDVAEVRAARADADLAESSLVRVEALATQNVLAEQQLEEARARALGARERLQAARNGARAAMAQLDSARAALTQATTAASEATVRAPFAGEIAERMVSVGEYVSPQSPLVTLVRTDPLRLEVSVPQQHVMDVRPGQAVHVRVDAITDRTFEGTVRYVSASLRRESRGLTVEAILPNADRVLRPGLFVTARIELGGAENVAVVPAGAVATTAGVDRVFVVRDGTIQERIVSVRDRDAREAVIGEGIAPGEQVAIEGLDRLADGVNVTVATAPDTQAPPAGR